MLRAARLPRVPEPAELVAALVHAHRRLWAYVIARERRPMWVALAASLVLILWRLELMPLGLAEAEWLVAAVTPAREAEASAPEFYTRLLALPLGPARDPRLAVALAIAVQLPALGVLYEVLQRHGGVRLAALAGVLIGSAPWAVLLARRVGPAALAVPLATLLLAGVISALCERRPWGWTLAWVSALTLCVLSADGVPALLLLALVTVLWPREVRWPFVLLGVLLWLLLTLSTLYDCPACAPWVRIAQFFVAAPAVQAGVSPLVGLASLLGGAGLGRLVLDPASSLTGGLEVLSQVLGWATLLGLAACAAFGLRAWARWREREAASIYAIPVLWVAVSLLVYSWRGSRVTEAQLAPVLPAGMLGLALVLDRLPRAGSVTGGQSRWGLWLAMALVISVSACRVAELYRQVDEGHGSPEYGTPLESWHLLATLASRTTSSALDPLWVAGSGSASRRAELRLMLGYLLKDESPLYLNGEPQPAMALPAERDVRYLLAGQNPVCAQAIQAWHGELAGLVASDRPAEAAELYRVPAQSVGAALASIETRDWAAWDAGLRLVGYDRPALVLDDQALVLVTYWTFESVPDADRASPHVLHIALEDARGALYEWRPSLGLTEDQWKPGLLVKQWHVLPLPFLLAEGPVEVRMALERTADGYRSRLLDGLERPIGDQLSIGPFLLDQ